MHSTQTGPAARLMAAVAALIACLFACLLAPSSARAATSYTSNMSSTETYVLGSSGNATEYTWSALPASTINLSSILLGTPSSATASGDLRYRTSASRTLRDDDTSTETFTWVLEANIPTGTTSDTTLDGSATLTWESVGTDEDGDEIDLSVTVQSVHLTPHSSYSTTTMYASVLRSDASGTGRVCAAFNAYTSSSAYVDEGTAWYTIDIVKHGTSTAASGTFLMWVGDIDSGDETITMNSGSSYNIYPSGGTAGATYRTSSTWVSKSGSDEDATSFYYSSSKAGGSSDGDYAVVWAADAGDVKFQRSASGTSSSTLFRRFFSTISCTWVGSSTVSWTYNVYWKNDKDVTLTVPTGYKVATLMVDGAEVSSYAGTASDFTYTFSTVKTSHTIVVTLEYISYTIAYNGNGATSGSVSSQTVEYNSYATIQDNGFTKTGYSFLGWAKSSSATSAAYSPGDIVRNLTSTDGATVTLYAVWSQDTYTVKASVSGSGGSVSPTSQTVGYGDAASKITATASSGYVIKTFIVYAGSTSGDVVKTVVSSVSANKTSASYTATSVTQNLVAVVTFQAINYVIDYDANAPSSLSSGSVGSQSWTVGSGSASIASGSALWYLNHAFSGWNSAADGSGTAASAGTAITAALLTSLGAELDNGSATVTLYAQWTASSSISVDGEGGFYITLKAGEYALIENLPAGTNYEVYEYTGDEGNEDFPEGWYFYASSDGTTTSHINDQAGSIEPLAEALAEFANTEDDDLPCYTSFTPYVYKTLDGSYAGAGEFSFTISGSGISTQTASTDSSGRAAFATIEYDEDDVGTTFTYTIVEVMPDGATEDSGYAADGIQYDPTTVTCKVKVAWADSDHTALTVTGGYTEDGVSYYYSYGGACTNTPTFANATLTGNLRITKEIDGSPNLEAVSPVFTATVTFSDGEVEQATLSAESDWTWESAYHKAGTTFQISEDEGSYAGYTWDVGATTIEGEATLTGAIAADGTVEAVLVNGYEASGSFTVRATKGLVGADVDDYAFVFQLVDAEDAVQSGGELGEAVASAVNDGADVELGPVALDAAGTFYYALLEVDDGDPDVDYDDVIYYLVVEATDDGAGGLDGTVTYHEGGAGGDVVCVTDLAGDVESGELAAFENSIAPGSLEVSKSVYGGTSATADQLFEFTITLEPISGVELADAYAYQLTDADGGVSEGTLELSASGSDGAMVGVLYLSAGETALVEGIPAGTLCTVVETTDSDEYFPGDGDEGTGYSVYSVAGDASLGTDEDAATSVARVYSNETAEARFVNEYAARGSWTPEITKILTGGVDIDEGEFSFYLYEGELTLDGDGAAVTDGAVLLATATVTDGQWEGSVLSDDDLAGGEDSRYSGSAEAGAVFTMVVPEDETQPNAIVYDELDDGQTYTYSIVEVAGTDDDISYDASVITVTVSVVDDGDGTMTVTASYDGEATGFFTNVYDHLLELVETGGAGGMVAIAAGACVVVVSAGWLARRGLRRMRRRVL